VRRIEALTGRNALHHFKKLEDTEHEIARLLKVDTGKVTERLKTVLEEEKTLHRRITQLSQQLTAYEMKAVKPEILKDGTKLILMSLTSRNPEMLRNLADEIIESQGKRCVGVLGTEFKGKGHLVAFVSKDLAKSISANAIIKEIASIIQGGGGGREEFATAGGKNPKKLLQALKAANEYIVKKLT
jgi:alanyl-tRNA synthetase